jgi:hypothetical protein
MLHTSLSKTAGALLICLAVGLVSANLREANAQSSCWSCSDQRVVVPIYLQFGVDPYNPRQIHYQPFTPLQMNPYQSNRGCGCLPCETSGQVIGLVDEPAPAVAVDSTEVIAGQPEIPITKLEVQNKDVSDVPSVPRELLMDMQSRAAKAKADSQKTASSPSDIKLSPNRPSQPTLADDASSENLAQLDQARKQIARLKAEVSAAQDQVLIAMERARAAEKKANEANSAADSSRQQIEKLQKAMTRQIKNSGEKIRKRNQALLKKLLDDGKQESDPEVLELKQKMKTELEENEAKIRQRTEERIKRIRKEAAARAGS